MSIAASTWALHDAPTTSAQELVILWAMADVAHSDGTASFQKQSTLARVGRCDERTVRRHLKAMEERGLIRRGDQRLVSHLPKDRRPIVWELDMSMRRSDDESGDVDGASERGDKLSPRARTSAAGQSERGDTVVPPRGDTGDRPRGDTGVPSIEPSFRTVHRTNEGGCVSGVPHLPPAAPVDNPPPLPALVVDPIAEPVSPRPDDEPPMSWCVEHPGGTTDSCAACGAARRARNRWETETAKARAAHRRAEIVERNQAEADEIDACGMCDPDGWTGPAVKCLHDPHAVDTARRGAARVRAALAAKSRPTNTDPRPNCSGAPTARPALKADALTARR